MDWSERRGLVVLAVGYQWFYNGANFVAFKVAGDALHPLMVGALRFLIAGLLLLPFAVARRRRGAISPARIANAALLGVIMLVTGQTLGIWGTHLLPAGVASVFSSASPLFLALFAWALIGRPLTPRQMAGVAVGFVGLVLIGLASARAGGFSPLGAAMALASSGSWALGSLFAPKLTQPDDPVVGLAVQTLVAGGLLSAVVAVTGIAAETRFDRVPLEAWGAIGFLVVASTLVGYAVFLALNSRVSSTLANTFNYAAPAVALVLAALLLHEPLTAAKIIAATIALGGVALMISGQRSNQEAEIEEGAKRA